MDYGERLAKVEAEVDSIKGQLQDIKDEQVRLREHMDRGFAEMRAEQARATRWLIGMGISYGVAIVGLIAKISGMF